MRKVSKWGVGIGGLGLAAWGLAAMWRGWDQILIERGWSLFIGGATALSGGVVTMALALVVGRLDALIALSSASKAEAQAPLRGADHPSAMEPLRVSPPPAPAPPPIPVAPPVVAAPIPAVEAAPAPSPIPAAPAQEPVPSVIAEQDPEPAPRTPEARPTAAKLDQFKWTPPKIAVEVEKRLETAPARPPAAGKPGAIEVDRYVSGDTTYVMFSDGSVELRDPQGARRYASLAELRARASAQR